MYEYRRREKVSRVYNFSAGPAVLPEEVLIRQDISRCKPRRQSVFCRCGSDRASGSYHQYFFHMLSPF